MTKAQKKVIEAAKALINSLDKTHASEKYKNVWHLAQNHLGVYQGPSYAQQRQELAMALDELEREEKPPTLPICPECNKPQAPIGIDLAPAEASGYCWCKYGKEF